MENFSSIQDFENHALSHLPQDVQNYYTRGSGSQETVKLNKEAFKRLRIHPKLLRNVSMRNISTFILGEKISMPLGISPTGLQKLAHSEGECANAKAYANSSIQEVANAAPQGIKWLQLTILKDRDCIIHLVRRAEQAGFKAIVVTIDNPVMPDSKTNKIFTISQQIKLSIYQDYFETKYSKKDIGNIFLQVKSMMDDSLTWKDVSWLKRVTKLPIVVKGVLRPEDALLAIKHGASGILVSNHGGRQLDSVPATIEVLPNIVKAVGDRAEVYMDGGIRQGTDVFKALALGAKMVFMGRPLIWGLACGGVQGARAILEMIRNDIDETFAMAGCSSVQEITQDFVTHEILYAHL
ncbi:2-Hydroxyacid oxidase 1-like isoform X2 [Phymastichus coffea]|uniref:2-Hydroxyacid oxidase 1-like isoform X2 n=1 Tax=Phymastichus coffea TaxID=108790 RepID=UPI00273C62EA|nr:2-Hydroxyacid oxidase 1-like isoform X2 [Phymastichus coffea]